MYQPFGLALPPRLPWRLRAAIEATVDRLIAICDADDGDLDVEWNGDEFEPWGDDLGDVSWPERGDFERGIKLVVVGEVAASRRQTDYYLDFDMFEPVAWRSCGIGEDDEICPDAAGEGDMTGNGHLGAHLPDRADQTRPLNAGHVP